jgi:hypothetical protein
MSARAHDDHHRDLESRVRSMLAEADAPPQALVDAAKASLTWLDVDHELATLVSDSAVDAAAPVRAYSPPRVLTFTAGETTLVVEIATERRVRRVLGQIVPVAPATVEIRHADGPISAPADQYGRFRIAPVPDGPVSIVCRFDDPGHEPLVTSWLAV